MFRLLCFFTLLYGVNSARILAVFPVPSISHQLVFRRLTNALLEKGHELVVITTDPEFKNKKLPNNLTEIDVHDLSYKIWTKGFTEKASGKIQDLYTKLKISTELILQLFVEQIQLSEVKNVLQDKNFDLVLIEACVRPALVLSHLYKVPIIQVSSFGGFYDNYEVVGASTHPILYPSSLRHRFYNLTSWEKITEIYNYYYWYYDYIQAESKENEALKEYFGEVPSLSELSNNVDMLFLNVHRIWDSNRPVPPNVLYMGGIHQNLAKRLPKDLELYLNSSINGVIYFSLGTNSLSSMLPPEKLQKIIKVFSQVPYDVIWKWDKEELPGKPENVKIAKWLPQVDLLNYPKVKLFITQAGLQSTDEAITAGVPLLGIPLLGDQWFNAEKYAHLNIGMKLEMETVTEDDLKTAIYKLIKDDSYRKNIIKLRSIMYDQPESALNRAVWWTEHVLRHGGARHLRAPAANMSWTEYYELKLILLLLAGVLLTSMSVTVGSYWISRSVFSVLKKKTKLH